MSNSKLKERLVTLANEIGEFIQNGIDTGDIRARSELFHCTTFQGEVKYSDSGAVVGPATQTVQVQKKVWDIATYSIQTRCQKMKIYAEVLSMIKESKSEAIDEEYALNSFITAICNKSFSDEGFSPLDTEAVEYLVVAFLREVSGGGPPLIIDVRLDGLVLNTPNMVLRPGITIRQPVKEDFEGEVHNLMAEFGVTARSHPSSIVSIELERYDDTGLERTVRQAVERLITIMRLYRVCSVQYISYGARPTLFGPGVSTTFAPRDTNCMEIGEFVDEDSTNFASFYEEVDNALCPDLYETLTNTQRISSIGIAYGSYNNALFRGGSIEERIADAVVGLEALLLDDYQELSYRLALRASKLMSVLGMDGLRVRDLMNTAYRIRSLYSHGVPLKQKEITKIEKKIGPVGSILIETLEFIRRLLVLNIVAPMQKSKLLKLIDNSFVSDDAHAQLLLQFKATRRILELNG